jgi:hypothetical protein
MNNRNACELIPPSSYSSTSISNDPQQHQPQHQPQHQQQQQQQQSILSRIQSDILTYHILPLLEDDDAFPSLRNMQTYLPQLFA